MTLGLQARSGIETVGDLNWGAHFCLWYRRPRDLLDARVPFFAEGLVNNEQCIWTTSEPLSAEEAGQELVAWMPTLSDPLTAMTSALNLPVSQRSGSRAQNRSSPQPNYVNSARLAGRQWFTEGVFPQRTGARPPPYG